MVKALYFSIYTTFALLIGSSQLTDMNHSEDEIKKVLNELFAARSHFLVDKTANMTKYYDPSHRSSRNAYRVEKKRKDYLNTWADYRGVHFTDSKSKIRVTRIQIEGDTAKVTLAHSQKLSYIYVDQVLPPQSFGIGTWHAVTLKKRTGIGPCSKSGIWIRSKKIPSSLMGLLVGRCLFQNTMKSWRTVKSTKGRKPLTMPTNTPVLLGVQGIMDDITPNT